MAYETNVGLDFTFPVDFDATVKQHYFVTLGSDGYLNIAGAGNRALGVIQDGKDGSSTTKDASVRTGGISKVLCGGTFVKGDLVSSDASGKAVKYTGATVFTGTPYTVSGTQVLGVALEAGASGQLAAVLIQPSGLSA